MIKKIVILNILFIWGIANAGCLEKVIYGEDNRRDIFESSSNLYKKLAEGTAAMIAASSIESQGNIVKIKSGTLEDDGVCSDARFVKQKTAAVCSGFLVGDDLLVTAGHCILSMSDCDSYVWVFGYSNMTTEQNDLSINKKDIYRCTKIISRSTDGSTNNDFALVKLDRPTDRKSLNYRKEGQVSSCSELVVIGHPSGLPTKISDGAYVRKNNNKYFFVANLDTFGGNSGSAVFDTRTGLVEGILVRGEMDYIFDSKNNCYLPKKCEMNECRGEDVTRITNIEELKK